MTNAELSSEVNMLFLDAPATATRWRHDGARDLVALGACR
jgi:hypothetical protein